MSCHSHEDEECYCDEGARIGAPVYPFTMDVYDPQEGLFGTVSLETLREQKKWCVLFFYPADFTFVCPTELADLAAKHEALTRMGCEVISVSTDTKFVHLAWKQAETLLKDVNFKMAADPTSEISQYFGVYDEDSGLALRGTFIINPEGVLVSSEVNFYNVGRNADELVRKMEANVYLLDHPAEACPAKWVPGAQTLTPSEKLVGKVGDALK